MTTITEGIGTQTGSPGLAELYERHAPAAVRLAYLITGDAELSRDVVQDAFVRVAGRFRHLRLPDAFDAYLRRAVVNLCTSHFRRARLERRHAEREATIRPGVIEGPDIGDRDELAAALSQLPVRQRTAIVLHYYEDLTERQVADAMGCSSSAAGSLISRGVETLRGRLGNGAGR